MFIYKKLQLVSIGCVFILFISGCSVFGPVKSQKMTAHNITAVPQTTTHRYSRPITLLVTEMESDPRYSGTEMAYVIQPYQIKYFAKNGWTIAPSKMIQALLVQTLRNTHYFNAIITPPPAGRFNYVLHTRLIKLQQEFSSQSNTSYVVLTIYAELIDAATKKIIATKEFTTERTAPVNSPIGGVIAANTATKDILLKITTFCLRKIR